MLIRLVHLVYGKARDSKSYWLLALPAFPQAKVFKTLPVTAKPVKRARLRYRLIQYAGPAFAQFFELAFARERIVSFLYRAHEHLGSASSIPWNCQTT